MDQVFDEQDWPGLPPLAKRLLFRPLARLAVLLGKMREIAPLVGKQALV